MATSATLRRRATSATLRAAGRPGKTVRLRCVTAPDEGQKVLLSRLGLTLPQRLRRVDEVAKCSEDFSP
jgi:hypothetical protein